MQELRDYLDEKIQTFDNVGVIFRRYTGPGWQADVLELDDCGYVQRIDVEDGLRNHGKGTEAIKMIGEDFWRLYFAPDNRDSARLFARLGEKVEGLIVDNTPMDCLDAGYGIYEV
jgi:hypothetical protein